MKKIIYISLFVLFLISNSCKSPLEVDANRVSNIKLIPTGNTEYLSINENILDFGFVYKGDQRSVSLLMLNDSDTPIKIDSARFDLQPTNFSVNQDEFPFVLAPKGNAESGKIIEIRFNAENIGLFSNRLSFNYDSEPNLDMIAIVPSVYSTNLDFGEQRIGVLNAKSIKIVNHSDQLVTIRGFEFEDTTDVFNVITPLPQKITPGMSKFIVVGFLPKVAMSYKTKIKFIMSGGSGYKDGNSSITGKGVYR